MKCRKRTLGLGAMLLSALLVSSVHAATKITSIDFKADAGASVIEIASDAQLEFTKQDNAQDNQVVLEVKNSALVKGAERKLDTSSFNSRVSLISPYQVEGQPDTTRVVIQLREMADVQVEQQGNLLKLTVPGSGTIAEVPASVAPVQMDAAPADPVTPSVPEPASPTPPTTDMTVNGTPVTKAQLARTNLESFMDTAETKRFSGKPITLQVRDADLSDVLRLIGEASGFNIVVADDVRGKITLSLVDVPWDQALDVVLHTKQLGAERNNNILRIVTLAGLTQEKQAELSAKKAAEASAPRVTRVFPISYAKLSDLKKTLETFGGTNTGGGSSGSTSLVDVDERTNSLIVRDIPDNIDRMRKMIELLDTQTPQVLIEAKVVEASEGFQKAIGGSLGMGRESSPQFVASFSGGNPLDPLLGTPGVFSSGSAVAGNNPNGTTLGTSLNISFLPGVKRLNALLSLGETEHELKVVSSPKMVVLNKESATITQGTPVLVPGTSFVAGVGSVPTTSVQSADLTLNVKPTATNDGNILMNLNITHGVPASLGNGSSAVANRNINTVVVVESGTTLVIGGIYTMRTSKSSSGFPFLRKLPIIGAFFGNESEDTNRSELFIFITPRILNEKEAGLTS